MVHVTDMCDALIRVAAEGQRVGPAATQGQGVYYVAADRTITYAELGRLGRLNPKTGEIKEWPSPSGADTQPYAITVVNDIIWYNESRRRPDALVRFDPKTEKFQSWAIPSGVGIIRHMRKTPDGNLTIHQTSTNRIGLAMIGKPVTSGSAPR